MEERKDLWCRVGKYGLDKMENRKLQNTYCMEHSARTCCDHHDTNRLRSMYETLRQKTEVSKECLGLMENAICSHCDPDMGSGVYDGFCTNYCDLLLAKCGQEYFDPYADTSQLMPICKDDSLICSQITDMVKTGKEFCEFVGFPVSKLAEPTMSKVHDCYNGRSSVGPKYDRLDIDFDLVNKRDFPDDDDEEDED